MPALTERRGLFSDFHGTNFESPAGRLPQTCSKFPPTCPTVSDLVEKNKSSYAYGDNKSYAYGDNTVTTIRRKEEGSYCAKCSRDLSGSQTTHQDAIKRDCDEESEESSNGTSPFSTCSSLSLAKSRKDLNEQGSANYLKPPFFLRNVPKTPSQIPVRTGSNIIHKIKIFLQIKACQTCVKPQREQVRFRFPPDEAIKSHGVFHMSGDQAVTSEQLTKATETYGVLASKEDNDSESEYEDAYAEILSTQGRFQAKSLQDIRKATSGDKRISRPRVLSQTFFDKPTTIHFLNERTMQKNTVLLYSEKALQNAAESCRPTTRLQMLKKLSRDSRCCRIKGLRGAVNSEPDAASVYGTQTFVDDHLSKCYNKMHIQKVDYTHSLERIELFGTVARKVEHLITPKFQQMFYKYARYKDETKTGRVITKTRSSVWQKRSGLYNGIFDAAFARESFVSHAGRKIVLDVYDYMYYLVAMAQEKNIRIEKIIQLMSSCPEPSDKIQNMNTIQDTIFYMWNMEHLEKGNMLSSKREWKY